MLMLTCRDIKHECVYNWKALHKLNATEIAKRRTEYQNVFKSIAVQYVLIEYGKLSYNKLITRNFENYTVPEILVL